MLDLLNKAKSNLFAIVSFWFSPAFAILIATSDAPPYQQIIFILFLLSVLKWVLGEALKSMPDNDRTTKIFSWLANYQNILTLMKETLRYFVRVGFWYGVVIVFTVAAPLLFFRDNLITSEQIINFGNNGWIYPIFIGWVITVMMMLIKSCHKLPKR